MSVNERLPMPYKNNLREFSIVGMAIATRVRAGAIMELTRKKNKKKCIAALETLIDRHHVIYKTTIRSF